MNYSKLTHCGLPCTYLLRRNYSFRSALIIIWYLINMPYLSSEVRVSRLKWKSRLEKGLVCLSPRESCLALAELFLLLFLTWCQTPGSSPHFQGAGVWHLSQGSTKAVASLRFLGEGPVRFVRRKSMSWALKEVTLAEVILTDQSQRCSCDDHVSGLAVSYYGVLHPSLRQDQSVHADV